MRVEFSDIEERGKKMVGELLQFEACTSGRELPVAIVKDDDGQLFASLLKDVRVIEENQTTFTEGWCDEIPSIWHVGNQ